MGLPDGEKLSMGGNTGVFYGKKEIEYPDDGNLPDPEVTFSISEFEDESEIEGNRLPQVNDLILNIDGCFYRVMDILDEVSVLTNRITLQGTGGGGGSPDGPGAASLRISAPSGQTKYYSTGAKAMVIDIAAYSSDMTNYISIIECSFDKDFSENFLSFNLTHPLETPYSIDLIGQKDKFSDIAKRVYVRVTDRYGATRSLPYTITIAKLEISSSELPLIQATGNVLRYRYAISGNSAIFTERKTEFHFYDNNGVEIQEYYQEQQIRQNQIAESITKDLNVENIDHGNYEMRVKLTGIAGGTSIDSNELVYKVIVYNHNIGLPIFSYLLPEVTEQYTDIPLSYLLTYGIEQKDYSLEIYVNNEYLTTQILSTGVIQTYNLSFDEAKTYNIELKISELNIVENFNLVITSYTGMMPVVDVTRDDLILYLTAKGRTNESADKNYWSNYKNTTQRAELKDFYYRSVNGWMIDEKNNSYLSVNQGANFEFKDYTPFDTDPTETGLTIELDFMIENVFDYSKNLIECISKTTTNNIKTGFTINGDTFKYYAGGNELTSLNLVKGNRIKLSYVIEPSSGAQKYPMCYTFLNGIISNVFKYDTSYDFTNSSNKAYLKIDSTAGHIRIYNIRIYNSALSEQTILNNYQATLDTLEDRQNSAIGNNITDFGDIKLRKIADENYPLQIPYVKIFGGLQSDKEFVMAKEGENKSALPIGKKDYRAIDIEVVYPKENQNPYFKDYKDFKLTTTFEDANLNVLTGFGQQAKTGSIMYAQGTSSLEYPVKNLRVKFKGDKIKVRPDLEPVKLVTFKADFMESSGSHNTGAANFIDTAYEYIKIQTPGQKYYSDESIVTCIKGHPCVIFWNPGIIDGKRSTFDSLDDYIYIGKYNLNLDKATPEPFGFKNDPEIYDASAEKTFGWDENGNNSIFCFEFLDNNVKVCNFLSDETSNKNSELKTEAERYRDTWYGDRINEEGKIVPGWRIGFESRHPEDKEGLNDADALWPLASWLNELYEIYQSELAAGKKPTDIDYIYEYNQATEYNEDFIYYTKTESGSYILAFPTEDNFQDSVYYTRKVIRTTYAMESIRRFKDEYQRYLDPEFLLAYYVITEALLMADSRVKNMMIATWGKEHRSFTKNDGTIEEVYNYIWYPIFYDMDTMLGLDNIGYVNKNYYDEDTNEGVFNGDEVLWKLTRDTLSNEISQFYNRLETSNSILTKNGILPFFNKNQANMANETFYNEDAFYKYIDTFRNGYTNHLTGDTVAPGDGDRLYAAQGDRSMMREWFVDNRIKYLRGKHSSTNYQNADRIEFRLTYPKLQVPTGNNELTDEQIRINKSIAAVEPSGDFNFTALKTGFAGVKIGKNSTPISKRFIDGQQQTISVDTSSGNGTETYLLGISNLQDVGDLSDKYLYKLVIGAEENNLKKLILGNHNQDYYNPYWGEENSIELNGFKFLEEFNLENCDTFKGAVNFSDCPQIKTIKLNGSRTSAVQLPIGGVLEELRLPPNVTNFSIDSHQTLSDDNFTIGHFNYNTNQYENDLSRLSRVSIKGTPEINTYKIAKETTLKNAYLVLEAYCFHDFVWTISDEDDYQYDSTSGQISGIKVLEVLKTLQTYDNTGNHANALKGEIIIDVTKTANEFDIYEKYHSTYPNVVISYSNKVILDAAPRINFYNSDIFNENLDPYYSVLSNGNYNLKVLTSEDGPGGQKLSPPSKLSTNTETYSFTKSWKVTKTQDSQFSVGDILQEDEFENIIPKDNLDLIPIFDANERLYEVILYDYNETELIKEYLPFDADIGLALKSNAKSYYNYREYSGNKPDYRYEFRGWQTEYDFRNDPTKCSYNSLIGKKVNSNVKLYALYVEQNCLTTISDSRYFSAANGTLSIKSDYKGLLKGKITLPSYDDNKLLITKIAKNAFEKSEITDVYTLNDAKYEVIEDNAFDSCGKLINIHNLLNNVTSIGNRSFALCTQLELMTLPNSLKIIGQNAFANSPKISISEFGTENSGSSLELIRKWAFYNCGDNAHNEIHIGKDLWDGLIYLSVEDGAFDGYANKKNLTVYLHKSFNGNPGALGFKAGTSIIQS